MYFEGSEKKLHLKIEGFKINLLALDKSFWQEIVAASEAQIISSMSNSSLNSFILSESSLFVWRSEFLLITCGESILIRSLFKFLNKFKGVSTSFSYQRKKEDFPRKQKTTFKEDLLLLQKEFSGKVFIFGEKKNPHYFYFKEEPKISCLKPRTSVFLYNIQKSALHLLQNTEISKEKIREFLQVKNLLLNWQFDDYLFSPWGYSLNGINGEDFFTLHINPQNIKSTATFEYCGFLDEKSSEFLKILGKFFNPERMEIITINSKCPHFPKSNILILARKKFFKFFPISLDFENYENKTIKESSKKLLNLSD